MNPVRQRRLQSDAEALHLLARELSGRLAISSATGTPPDTYRLVYRCRSIVGLEGERARIGGEHHVRLYLPAQYPALPPVATVLTPILNPHIWPNGTVCLGAWSITEKLDSVALRVASLLMLEPDAINLRSVADDRIVPWVQQHRAELPLDSPMRPAQTPAC